MSVYSLVLAFGDGEGMNTKQKKPLICLLDKPMLKVVLDTAEKTGSKETVVAIDFDEEALKDFSEVTLVKVKGFEEALKSMTEKSDANEGTLLVLSADMPLIKEETLKEAIRLHQSKNVPATAICSDSGVDNCKKLWLIDVKALKNTGDIEKLLKDAEIFKADKDELIKISDRIKLAEAGKILNKRNLERLMLSGVSIVDPDNTYIGEDAIIGIDTVIFPGTHISGKTVIGENASIGPNSIIDECIIGDNTSVLSSKLMESTVGNNVSIGPFAYLRPNSKIADNVKIGDFVEIKNASIDEGTKVSHLTYIGDADVGKKVNFGCGTVVCNYDGKKKHRTSIGDSAFIGCNTNLVAPVTVKDGAYTAAGSTITQEVPENALAIARARQVNKDNWVKNK